MVSVFTVALVWCGTLIGARTLWKWDTGFLFLGWNLALAAIPLLLSTLLVNLRRLEVRIALGGFWLMFFPNAPYIITDFVHLNPSMGGTMWLDILTLFSCAVTGLALGCYSLVQIHRLFIAAGKARMGWVCVVITSFLSGFGIYLGRFLRWRSVDALYEPAALVSDVMERLLHPTVHYRAWGVTLGFGTFLLIAYVMVTCLTGVLKDVEGGKRKNAFSEK
jgi:uncharacterized membrane protein